MGADFLASWSSRVLSLLRIVTALLFLEHATTKLFGFPHIAYFDNLQPFSLFWIAGAIELPFSVLLLFGLFTRAAAFILSGEMAIAYFTEHAPHSFFPLLNDGESAVLFCFIFLYLAVAGGGAWSVDNLRAGRG